MNKKMMCIVLLIAGYATFKFGRENLHDKVWIWMGQNHFYGMEETLYKAQNPSEGLVKSYKLMRHEVEALEKIRLDNFKKASDASRRRMREIEKW